MGRPGETAGACGQRLLTRPVQKWRAARVRSQQLGARWLESARRRFKKIAPSQKKRTAFSNLVALTITGCESIRPETPWPEKSPTAPVPGAKNIAGGDECARNCHVRHTQGHVHARPLASRLLDLDELVLTKESKPQFETRFETRPLP